MTLREIYGEDVPERDELFWEFVSMDDFDTKFEVIDINVKEWVERLNLLETYEEHSNEEQKSIVKFYMKNVDHLKGSTLVIYDDILLDGNHRLIAAYLSNIETMRCLDIYLEC